MEVMAGYKATDVGVIPIDWDVGTVADVVTSFQNGFAFASHGYVKSGMPIVTMAQIGLDGVFNFQSEAVNYWPLKAASALAAFQLVGGDIIVAMTDVTPQKNLIGRMVQVTEEGPLLLNQRVGLLRISAEKVDPYFLRAISNSSGWRTYARAVASLGVQANISTTDILSGKLPLPSLQEQRAIATALSDVDALIAGLEKLIAKKRNLKQAAMQQLLTGQTRLPGFSGEWVTKLLSELADIRSGGTPSTNDAAAWDGDIAWCTPTDITALAGQKYLTRTERHITEHGLKQSSAEVIPVGSIVMTSRATVGECAINVIPTTTNQGFKNFVPFESVDAEFFYYLLVTQKAEFLGLCSGSTFLEIGKTQLRGFAVQLPSTKAEQTAISTVLSEMDSELKALETRHAKTRELKQGMMQELLTGGTRLV